MLKRTAIPYLLILLLMACSGAVGPTGAGPVGAGPVGGGGVVGGNLPQSGNQAAPGTEEVMLGPGAADPQDAHATMECEWKCEPAANGEGSQMAFKGKVSLPGNRVLRIYEYLFETTSGRYQDIQADTEGNFSFVLSGSEGRDVSILLLKPTMEAKEPNKVFPCQDSSCKEDESGNHLPGVKGKCFDSLNSTDLVCDMPLKFPRINLNNIKIPNS